MALNKLYSDSADSLKRLAPSGYFQSDQLPLYKDKPYGQSPSKVHSLVPRSRSGIGLLLFAFCTACYVLFLPQDSKIRSRGLGKQGVDWLSRRDHVREAFTRSWDGYAKYAWGQDVYRPLSKEGSQMYGKGKGMGWIIVDALDTMMIMNLTAQLSHACTWISTTLTYDQDVNVNTFETTIRMLGGLLSAHYLSNEFPNMTASDSIRTVGEDFYLEKATDLADRLMGAFDSRSGIPYASVNLKTSQGIVSHADSGASSTAEATSLQLEFKYLSHLTGEVNYWHKAERVMAVVDANNASDGLVPIFIHPDTGLFMGDNIRLGSRGDSYYEYLIKQFLQTDLQEPLYEEMWNESLAGVRKHLITYSKRANLTVLAEKPSGLGGQILPKMDHLVCFMPGTIALAITQGFTVEEAKRRGLWNDESEDAMQLARELTKTCWGMYKVMATGLAPEIAHFELHEPLLTGWPRGVASAELSADPKAPWRDDFNIKHNDNHNLQRPETVESLFYMWRITQDPIYREWGWEMFQNFIKYTKADDDAGYTSLAHANEIPPILKDNMESFWLAETLKYLYLLFSPNEMLPLESIVMNTEAHIFPRFKLGRNMKTGWQRKDKKTQGMQSPS